jgi:Cell wall-associated hydrolases (invasion-associated proteins)
VITLLRRLVIPTVMLLAVVLVPSNVAQAQSAAELERRIDEAWEELEPVIEDYNRVKSELEKNQKKSEKLAEKLVPLEMRLNLAMESINEVAAHYYKGGNFSALNSLLASGSPTAFMEQLVVLNLVARDQQEQIEEVSRTKRDYEDQKAEIDALILEQEEQVADLERRKDEIESELAELEELLDAAYTQVGAGTGTGTGEVTGGCPAVTGSGPGYTAAQFACAQIGKPYQYGSSGPNSYDCSGLTQAAWAAAGVSLTHYTGAQWNEGTPVSRAEAIPGDLVFFYDSLSHVGIYVGNGLMVDAPRTGLNVSMRSIDTMPIAGFRRPG